MKSVAIKTLGCKVNSYESEFVRSLFVLNGYKVVEENADVYVINTCTVTNESDKKSKKIINSIRRKNKNSIIIAMGCFCQYKKQNINEYIDADIVIGNKDKSKVIEYLNDFIEKREKKEIFYDMNEANFENMEIKKFESRTRAFIKIEDGCNNFCSYCIIPYVRGRVRSKIKESVLKEVKSLGENGHKEIVLTGIHTGQYGRDLENYNLAKLINDISKDKNILRIRLSSIEVNEITDEMLEVLKNNEKFVSHMHIPLQSGCDKILESMNRRYDKEYFRNKINLIKKIRENISISTDLIVGFPGETEEDFNETYEFLKEIKFTKIHVFPYSDRNGTKASLMSDKIDNKVKKERVKKVLLLSKKLEEDYNKLFIGKNLEILFEEEKEGFFIGHAPNYLKVRVKGNYKIGQIINIIITEDMIMNG